MTRTGSPGFEEGTLNAYVIEGREIKPGDRFGYKVILKVDEYSHSFRAYMAPTTKTDEQVESYGDPVSEQVVKALFPSVYAQLKALKYFYNS